MLQRFYRCGNWCLHESEVKSNVLKSCKSRLNNFDFSDQLKFFFNT